MRKYDFWWFGDDFCITQLYLIALIIFVLCQQYNQQKVNLQTPCVTSSILLANIVSCNLMVLQTAQIDFIGLDW